MDWSDSVFISHHRRHTSTAAGHTQSTATGNTQALPQATHKHCRRQHTSTATGNTQALPQGKHKRYTIVIFSTLLKATRENTRTNKRIPEGKNKTTSTQDGDSYLYSTITDVQTLPVQYHHGCTNIRWSTSTVNFLEN